MLFRSLYDGEQSFHERKKVQEPTPFLDFFDGAGERTRTADLLITNQLLYRLSHTSIFLLFIPSRFAVDPHGEKSAACFISREPLRH